MSLKSELCGMSVASWQAGETGHWAKSHVWTWWTWDTGDGITCCLEIRHWPRRQVCGDNSSQYRILMCGGDTSVRGVSGETCAVFGAVKDARLAQFRGGCCLLFGRTYKSKNRVMYTVILLQPESVFKSLPSTIHSSVVSNCADYCWCLSMCVLVTWARVNTPSDNW